MVDRNEPHAAERNRFLNAATRLFGTHGEPVGLGEIACWDQLYLSLLAQTIEEYGLPGKPSHQVYKSVRIALTAKLINGYYRQIAVAMEESADAKQHGRLI